MIQKLIQQYKKLQLPVRASVWFLVCGFLQKAISMLTSPIFTRIMTDVEYGRFNVYNSWLGIVQILVSLNLTASVYTRGLVIYEEDQDRFASSVQGLSTTCMLIAALIYGVFYKQINDLLGLSTLLMTAMLIEAWASTAYYFWANRERTHYRYKKMLLLTLAFVILRPLAGIAFVLLADVNQQVEARVIAVVGVNVLLFSWLYRSTFRKGKCFFHKEYWRYALKFNIPLIPHYLAENILSQSDRLVIDKICGAKETAYYSLSYTIAMVMQILNNSIIYTINPWIYRSIKGNKLDKIGPVSYMVLLLVAGVNLAIILVAPELLRIMAPPTYQAAVWVIPPVTAGVYFMFLYNLFTTFEYFYAKTQYVTISTLAGALINMLLNVWLIPKFGFVAAGYTTLFCYILYAIAHFCIMRKICREQLNGYKVYSAKIILGISVGMLFAAMAITMLYKTVVIRYVLLLLLGGFVILKRKTLVGLLVKLKQH